MLFIVKHYYKGFVQVSRALKNSLKCKLSPRFNSQGRSDTWGLGRVEG